MIYQRLRRTALSITIFALLAAVLVGCQAAAPATSPGDAPGVAATTTAATESTAPPAEVEKTAAVAAATPVRNPSGEPKPPPETSAKAVPEAKPTPTGPPATIAVTPTPHSGVQESTPHDDCSSPFCSHSFWSFASVQDVLDELERGADPVKVNEDGMAPLHMAAQYSTREVVELLLDHGADVNARVQSLDDYRGATPLHMALMGNQDPGVIAALLEWGADIDAQDAIGMTPLQGAHFVGPEMVALLLGSSPEDGCRSVLCDDAFWHDANLQDVLDELERGADLSAVNDDGMAALHLAAKYSSPEIVELLLDRGAEVNARVQFPNPDDVYRESSRSTPLHLSVQHNEDPAVTAALLDRGADVHLQNARWETPLHLASDSRPDVLALLLERYPDLNTAEMLRRAALFDNIAVAMVLLEGGADVNYRLNDHNIATPLHGAVYAGAEMTRLLLEHGADPSATDSLGRTPLHHASDGSSEKPDDFTEIMAALIEYGADVDAVDDASGATPLHYAVNFKEPDAVALLLQHGAEVNIADSYGDTPLFRAASNSGMMAVLLEAGAEVNVTGTNGYSPLHQAIVYDSGDVTNCLTLLLRYGADIEARANGGQTPLHKAARWYNPEAAATLLEHGADTQAVDEDGSTPCQIANRVEIVGAEANERLDQVRHLLCR